MEGPTQHTSSGFPVWIAGDGPSVVLVHGVLMDHRMWFRQVAALRPDYRVVCLDMLGHGDAPDPAGARHLQDFVLQVCEVVDELCPGEKPVLGGFSMGGLIAQAFAIDHWQALSGLMLLNAVYDRSPGQRKIVRERFALIASGDVEAVCEAARPRWFNAEEEARRADEIEEILDWMRDGDFAPKIKAHDVFSSSDDQTAGRLSEVPLPALVMTGDGDGGSTPDMARKMAAELPDARLHILDNQQHCMPVLDAGRVNAIIRGFLADVFVAR